MQHNENSRVKIPALVHFTRLGYEYISLKKYTNTNLIDEDTNIFLDVFCRTINNSAESTAKNILTWSASTPWVS